MLPERRTGTTLGDMQLRSDLLNAGTRGLQVSLGGLLQDELVKRQIGDRLAKPVVLELKLLQPLYLFDLPPAKFLAPAIVGHLAHTDLTDCIRHNLTLRDQNIHLPVATSRRSPQACIASLALLSSSTSETYLKSDHFIGGGSGGALFEGPDGQW